MTHEHTGYKTVMLASGLGLVAASLGALAQDAAAPKGWKTSANLAAAMTRGNSDTVTVAAGLNAERKWERDELAFGLSYSYGEDRDRTTASSVGGYGQYNHLFTDRFYAYGRVDALHDDLASLAYRVAFSPGVGYYVLKNDKFTLSGEFGPGFVLEQFHHEDRHDYFTLRFGERFGWQISKTARLWQSFDYYPQVDDFGNYLMQGEIGIATKVTEAMDIRLVIQDTYRSRPADGRTENDFKLLAGVGYTF